MIDIVHMIMELKNEDAKQMYFHGIATLGIIFCLTETARHVDN